MPNMKIYVDDTLPAGDRERLMSALPPIRAMLCHELDVTPAACQFAVLSVGAMPDQPRVGVEIQLLPRPERTRDRITAVCALLQGMVAAATGTHAAVRASQLDPQTYVALK